MSYTYSLSTTIGMVRLLIMDNNASAYLFEDNEISTFLTLEGGDKWRAAALALETMAANEAYVLKRITLLDLSTDGPAVAKSLRERAAELRARATLEETAAEDGGFDIAEMVVDDFTSRQRLMNELLRNG